MKTELALLRQARINILGLTKDLSLVQLNKIPEGFNNNIAWNVAHLVVVQQLLTYGLAGLPSNVSKEMIEKYKKGSKPEGAIDQEEWDKIKALSTDLVDRFEEDLKKEIFQKYKPYSTSFRITLNTLEDAVQFNNLHEGLHFGYILALRKML